jgi:hypothetical protein
MPHIPPWGDEKGVGLAPLFQKAQRNTGRPVKMLQMITTSGPKTIIGMERRILPCKSSGADGRMMSKRSQTPASLRPLRSSLSSCVKILTNREEKKLPKYDDEDNVGYSQPEFSGTRCQKEGLDSRFSKAFTGLA